MRPHPSKTPNITAVTSEPANGGSMPSCQVISPADATRWQRTLDRLPASTRFLAKDWTSILKDAYGFAPRLIALETGDALLGALPFVTVKSPFTGTRGISLPFIDSSPAFCPDSAHYRQLFEKFVQVGKEEGWRYAETRDNAPPMASPRPSLTFYNHIVDLQASEDELFARLKSCNRRAIRKAQKEPLSIETSQSAEALAAFYALQCATRKRHGLPPQPYQFFQTLHRHLIASGKGCIISAHHEGAAIASCLYLEQGDIVHYKYGASDYRFQHLRANNLVMWEAIKLYAQKGLREMHFGRNAQSGQETLRRYKLSWGAREEEIHYLRIDPESLAVEPMHDEAYGWHNRIFRHLPKPLAILAGNLLYRHIA